MPMHSKPPLVSIGLPVYNRPNLLRRALQSLTTQSFTNLEIIVSDDCSPGDQTQKVVHDFMDSDLRIHYYRQETNLGPILNHKFVFEKATGEYFFWASEDDEWHETFVETGVTTLAANHQYAAWCCTIDNTDRFGRIIREYPGFSRFTSSRHKIRDITSFLIEPGIMGKANLFHSIYRRSALAQTIEAYFPNKTWGTDMCFNLAFLTRFNLIATDAVLFHKRVVRSTDCEERVDPIIITNPHKYIFPFKESVRYIHENYKAADLRYKPLVLLLLGRIPIAFNNELSRWTLRRLVYSVLRKIRQVGSRGKRNEPRL
ncbi:MAG: glycosyltransferase family 2 protein [bacterium]|nr:glycosyltransferase family 2 protein [bacterium]